MASIRLTLAGRKC